MKSMTWQKWTAIGIIAAVIITLIILHLVQPTISFAWCEVLVGTSFLFGGISGYLLKAKNIING